jgi:hypothetical protein
MSLSNSYRQDQLSCQDHPPVLRHGDTSNIDSLQRSRERRRSLHDYKTVLEDDRSLVRKTLLRNIREDSADVMLFRSHEASRMRGAP